MMLISFKKYDNIALIITIIGLVFTVFGLSKTIKIKSKKMNNKLFFHYLSYLQYPLLAGCMYFIFQSSSDGFNLDTYLKNMNNMLVLMGLAISFSTLQDTKKVSIKFEKKIWENPKAGNVFIKFLMFMTLSTLVFGVFGYFFTENETIKGISFGTIVFGIGLVSFTKTGIEIFENHRKDKKVKL